MTNRKPETPLDDAQQLEAWAKIWDQTQAAFGPPQPKKTAPLPSFFGMHSHTFDPDVAAETEPAPEDSAHWHEIARRLSGDVLLTEEQALASGPGKGVKFHQNPVHFASTGMDQSPSPQEPVRVTPNFSDGAKLEELIDLRAKLEKLESSLLAADIKKDHGKDDPAELDKKSGYKAQLDALWKKLNDLSNKLVPEPVEDVT